ncbi:dna repair protein sae2 [Neofusicoccum parvum]|uniref:Dna repair protein sae2 n=1 Tax=Neofusicoccum parvum TaxID=310453 RepID=A0ACB5S4W9_9PEZI|nr:dna repair protein sae2 [Neofusicoccum parvum]
MDDQKQDVAASQWHGMDDGDDAIERHSTILQQNIRNNHIRHQNEKRALERNNTKLLVRIDELEREHAELKRHLEAAMQTPSLAATQTELPSEANTYAPPRSSATVPTQDATVPFQEYKELERMYKDALRENDELRQKSERLATKHDIMKARVKEWNVWTAKNRAKKENSQRVGKGKSSKGFQVDVNTPPTPNSPLFFWLAMKAL